MVFGLDDRCRDTFPAPDPSGAAVRGVLVGNVLAVSALAIASAATLPRSTVDLGIVYLVFYLAGLNYLLAYFSMCRCAAVAHPGFLVTKGFHRVFRGLPAVQALNSLAFALLMEMKVDRLSLV